MGKGAANTILAMGGSCIPAWTASPSVTNLTVGGTLGVTGVLTANAGVVVDNFTLDGTELDLSSGDFALDVAGDVEINADGGCVNFKDASLALAAIVNTSCVGELRIHEAANYIGLKPPALSANQTWTWPAAVASCACDVLTCNGSGVLSWATAGGARSVAGTTDNGIVTFVNSGSTFAAEANLTFDNTTFSFSRSHTSALEAIFANTGTSSGDSMYVDIRNAGGGGEAGIVINGESTNYYYMGLSDGNPVMSIGAHSSRAFSNDTMRFSDAAPPVITYNTTHPTGTFDYVCESCGKHSHEKFECCGKVEWHDDVLAMREAAIAVNTMANPYEPGQNVSIDQMVMLGIMEYDTPIKPGRPERGAWLGLAPVAGTWFTWAGMYQNRERMDNYHAEHEAQIARLTARVEELENHG